MKSSTDSSLEHARPLVWSSAGKKTDKAYKTAGKWTRVKFVLVLIVRAPYAFAWALFNLPGAMAKVENAINKATDY